MSETTTYKGYTIEIEQEIDFPINPRTEYDNLGIMVCFHKRYNLGDSNHGIDHNQFKGWDEMEEYARKELGAVVILPLYLFDHSGITINTTGFRHCDAQGWDWGRLGFIYTTMDKIRGIGHEWKKLTPKRRKQVEQWLLAEVETYDCYLTGEVYWYRVTAPDGEQVHSCGGYFGSNHEESGLMAEARSVVEGDITYRLKETGIQQEMELTEAV